MSFTVSEGTSIAIIGGNGSGKSTTLKVIAGILEPDGGSISVDGRVSALLELGAGFHPELTGRENVFLNGSLIGLSRKYLRSNFDAIVAFSGLENAIDNPVKTYSSGMYARLGFAVAVNVDPDVLLIDEVLAVGDEEFQRRCAEKISELRSGGRTVVLVSHSLAHVQLLCDRALWLQDGHLMRDGSPSDVIDAYVSSVHPTATIDEHGNVRTGSGEARVTLVQLIDPRSGLPIESPTVGQPLTLRLAIECTTSVDDVTVGFAIKRIDGIPLFGTHTRESFRLDLKPGTTHMEYQFSSFLPLPTTMELAVGISDHSLAHVIDRTEKALRFDVLSTGGISTHAGVVLLPGTWTYVSESLLGATHSS